MSDRLTDFLVNLATDPDKLQQYAADPGASMDAAGLTPEERTAVLSRDTATIRQAMGQSMADHLTQTASSRQRTGGRKKAAKKGAKKGGARKGGAKKKGAAKKGGRKSGGRK